MQTERSNQDRDEPGDVARTHDGNRTRGVSTVVDATLALVLISAAVVVLGTGLSSDRESFDSAAADHAVGALSASTIHVEYSLGGIRRMDSYPGGDDAADRFERQHYGSVPDLLASAALANSTVDGRRATAEGGTYAAAVRGSVLELAAGLGYDARIVAVWRPYENASFGGRVAVGRAPPTDADVGTAVVRTDSGVELSAAAVRTAYRRAGRYEAAADRIARAVVARYFPPAETQRALEESGSGRARVVYRYRRVASILTHAPAAGRVSFDLTDEGDPLAGNGTDPATPNASAANAALADALSDLIEADLRATFTPAELSRDADVRVDSVRITVQVWEL